MQYVLLAFVSSSFFTASNIYVSDILETPSYFILPPYIKPPKIVLDLVHCEKKIEQMHQYTSNISWKFETGTVITFLFILTDHGMGILFSLPKFGQSLKPWMK